ncbi:MAG: rod shape-determining protein [Candidatus Cloacimonetes bacterium 4572_55]|nr:MAG: rod shape-determining protein [Candidatus Cloacimonetes bacterium 4572_55]
MSWLRILKRYLSANIAVDLGTANTLIYIPDKGVALNEPSVVALEKESHKLIAVGGDAKRMLGRTPDEILAIRPLKDGVISDIMVTERMLDHFLKKTLHQGRFFRYKSRVIICVPAGITEVERRAVRQAANQAGAGDIYLVSEPIAAAIGAGLNVGGPRGNMIIDIGGGTTEIAVIALDGIVCDTSIRVAGDEMDEGIVQHIKKKYNLLIGESTAEQIKFEIGSAHELEKELTFRVKGRDLIKGIPNTEKISSEEIRDALKEPVDAIVEATKQSLELTPPELASDIVDNGLVMTGGGSQLRGLGKLITKQTGLKVNCVENPMECVVRGAGEILENPKKYQKLLTRGKQL